MNPYRLASLTAALTLAACTSIPGDPSKMDAAQLKEWAKDNKGVAGCMNGKTAAGNVTAVYVSMDQTKNIDGTMTIEPDCRVTISNSGKVTPVQKPANP